MTKAEIHQLVSIKIDPDLELRAETQHHRHDWGRHWTADAITVA